MEAWPIHSVPYAHADARTTSTQSRHGPGPDAASIKLDSKGRWVRRLNDIAEVTAIKSHMSPQGLELVVAVRRSNGMRLSICRRRTQGKPRPCKSHGQDTATGSPATRNGRCGSRGLSVRRAFDVGAAAATCWSFSFGCGGKYGTGAIGWGVSAPGHSYREQA
ncbi:hypothetical protein P171DRAFT_115277 [Karstenula rhodostoma CBS 690.94]|uniref:Uncharacterized protein n=1 Tax=Karstenula rhodostoma CBS 690.94 TaxID=1392251 RepID=A0A9P4U895_9PLEO|nr:hypothetical protein P171DRAFT_115277 [Karstenula rhodostoma CBS 690.94]